MVLAKLQREYFLVFQTWSSSKFLKVVVCMKSEVDRCTRSIAKAENAPDHHPAGRFDLTDLVVLVVVDGAEEGACNPGIHQPGSDEAGVS